MKPTLSLHGKPIEHDAEYGDQHAQNELQLWRNLGSDIAIRLDNLATQKVSAMASASRVNDIQRENQAELQDMSAKLRELLG